MSRQRDDWSSLTDEDGLAQDQRDCDRMSDEDFDFAIRMECVRNPNWLGTVFDVELDD